MSCVKLSCRQTHLSVCSWIWWWRETGDRAVRWGNHGDRYTWNMAIKMEKSGIKDSWMEELGRTQKTWWGSSCPGQLVRFRLKLLMQLFCIFWEYLQFTSITRWKKLVSYTLFRKTSLEKSQKLFCLGGGNRIVYTNVCIVVWEISTGNF